MKFILWAAGVFLLSVGVGLATQNTGIPLIVAGCGVLVMAMLVKEKNQ